MVIEALALAGKSLLDKYLARCQAREAKNTDDTEQKAATEQNIHLGVDFRTVVSFLFFGSMLFVPIKDGVPLVLHVFVVINAWLCVVGVIFTIASLWVNTDVFAPPERRAASKQLVARLHRSTVRKALGTNVSFVFAVLVFINGALAMTITP